MYYYKVGNAPYKFNVKVEEYFAHQNENGEKVYADTSCYVEINETEFNRLEADLHKNDEVIFEMGAIKSWLDSHDYIINKHALGEYTDTDKKWTAYLKERKAKLERYNELENKLK